MSDAVLTTNAGGIVTVRLNRPDRLNAWDMAMRQTLGSLFESANRDPSVRALILTGTGDRALCAGQDLNEAQTFDGAASEAWIDEFRTFYNQLRRFEKPFVAALNGLAAGSAFQAVLFADQRVGHPGVRMGQPEINSGIPSMTGFWIIREILGLARATDLVLTGRLMPAEECVHVGLLNHLVPADQVLAKAHEVAEHLAAKPQPIYRLDKQRIAAATQAAFEDAFEAARLVHRAAFEHGAPQAQMARFLGG